MLIAVLSGFVLALLAPWVHRVTKGLTGWLMSLLPMGLFAYFVLFLGRVAEGDVIREVTPWVPIYGINLSFVLDGLSLLMVLIVTGIGALTRLENEVTVKRYRQEGSVAWLLPENADFEPIRVDLKQEHMIIEGVVCR